MAVVALWLLNAKLLASTLPEEPVAPDELGPEALRILGHQVITHLELRRNLGELERSVASHFRAEEALRVFKRVEDVIREQGGTLSAQK